MRSFRTAKVIKLIEKTRIKKYLRNASVVVSQKFLFCGNVCLHEVVHFQCGEAMKFKTG